MITATLPAPRNMALVFSLIFLFAAALLSLVSHEAQAQPVAQAKAMLPDTLAERTLACAACHGKEGRATPEGYFPRIAGKPAGYLYNQLLNFRDGHRRYPQMTYMVAHLSDDYLREMAEYFSSLQLPYPPPQATSAAPRVLEKGRALVMQGDPARKIPACTACHGEKLTGMLPSIPSVLGLSRDYLNAQFGAWRSGMRKAASPDCMAEISHKLTPDDIAALSTWLASQPFPEQMKAQAPKIAKLPIRCGSFPQ